MSRKHPPIWWKCSMRKKGTLHSSHILRYEILSDTIHQYLWSNKGDVSNTSFVLFYNKLNEAFEELKRNVH